MRVLVDALRCRRRFVPVLLVALISAFRVGALSEDQLIFEEVRLTGGSFELESKMVSEEACPHDLRAPTVEQASLGGAKLSIDSALIEYRNDKFLYRFCLVENGTTWVFEVFGYPTGDFAYERRAVGVLFVHDDGRESEDDIRLPIYSLMPPDLVVWQREADEVAEDPIVARLGENNPRSLRLRNELEGFNVLVRLQREVDAPAGWSLDLDLRAPDGREEVAIRPGADSGSALQLLARPSLVAAVRQVFDRDARSADLPLEVRAGTAPWLPLDLKVKLRCVPSLPELLAALVLGVALGSTGAFLWSRPRRSWKAWPRQASGSLILALVLWLLALVLAWGRNELKLFGYGVEPNDTISVLVTAMLIGLGGRRSWEWLKEKLPFGDSPKPTAAPKPSS